MRRDVGDCTNIFSNLNLSGDGLVLIINHPHFRLCDELGDVVEKSSENSLDITNLFEMLVINVAAFVHENNAVEQFCDIMLNSSIGKQVTRLAEVNQFCLDAKNELCLDYKYDNMIAEMKNTSWMSKFATERKKKSL